MNMKKAILTLAVLCGIGLMAGCSKEGDYAELIIGKWLPEYVYIEKFNESGDCIGTEMHDATEPGYSLQITANGNGVDTVLVQSAIFVMEFSSDGKVNSYKYGEEPTSDNQNRTYQVEGKRLIIHSHDTTYNTDFTSTLDINELNKKKLDISSDIHVSVYDSPEPPQDPDVRTQKHHTVFKRL